MKPAIITLTIYQGQTFDDEFVFRDPDGNPEDFTGYEARMQIRPTITDTAVVMDLTTANGRIVPLDNQGMIKFNVSAEDTADLSSEYMYETWWYDLEIYNVAGRVERLMQGAVVFWPETTR